MKVPQHEIPFQSLTGIRIFQSTSHLLSLTECEEYLFVIAQTLGARTEQKLKDTLIKCSNLHKLIEVIMTYLIKHSLSLSLSIFLY